MKRPPSHTGAIVRRLAVLAVASLAHFQSSAALLTFDLRVVSITPGFGDVLDAKTVSLNLNATDAYIVMELWGVVTGTDGIVDEGLRTLIGSIVSSPGTVPNRDSGVAGNLAMPEAPNTVHGNLLNTLISPWNTEVLVNDGQVIDLDGDGDLDVGSTSTSPNSPYIAARAPTNQFGDGTSPANFHTLANGREFKISDVTFRVTDLVPDGSTAVNYVAPGGGSPLFAANRASFFSDGIFRNGLDANLAVAAPVLVNVVPEPSTFGLAFLGAMAGAALRRSR